MPSLSELQRDFAESTIFGDAEAMARLGIVSAGIDPASRIAIYRNNVLGNYRKALAASYPVTRRLVGASFFDAAVEEFVRAYPSTRGDVNRYGDDLPSFLAAYAPAHALAYLPDVARLEWAIDQANIAADAAPLDLAALSTVPVDAWSELRFALHPSSELIESPYPILHIWRANQPDAGEETIDLSEGGDWLLVRRTTRGVTIERLDAGEHALLAALSGGGALSGASRRAESLDPPFDLTATLQRLVASQTIVAFSAPTATAKGSQR
jgi:hypothetical protein